MLQAVDDAGDGDLFADFVFDFPAIGGPEGGLFGWCGRGLFLFGERRGSGCSAAEISCEGEDRESRANGNHRRHGDHEILRAMEWGASGCRALIDFCGRIWFVFFRRRRSRRGEGIREGGFASVVGALVRSGRFGGGFEALKGLGCGLRAVILVEGEKFFHPSGEGGGEVGSGFRERSEIVLKMGRDERGDIIPVEWKLQGEGLVENTTQRVEIRTVIHRKSAELFRRNRVNRPGDSA